MSDGIFDASEPVDEESTPAVPDGITSKGWLQAMGVSLAILVASAILLGVTVFDEDFRAKFYAGFLIIVLAGFSFAFAGAAVEAARKGL